MTTAFGGNVSGVSLQPDGKIVAAGGSGEWALARYNPNGSLDATFGNGGKVTTVFGVGQQAGMSDVTIQADVKIVGAGHLAVSQNSFDWALARYNPNGGLDPSFGSGGMVTTDFGTIDIAWGLAIQTDGKIVAAGFTGAGGPNSDWALARYNADGSLDASFGTGGMITTDFGGGEAAQDLALQPDGKIVVTGWGVIDWGLARYNPNGSLDASFGNGGKVITDVPGGGAAFAVLRQSNGKIVVVGNAFVDSEDFALARYNPNGSLDASFGNGGIVTTDFGRGEALFDGVLQTDGKIVAAGSKTGGIDEGFALARYEGDPVSLPKCQGRPATIVGTNDADTLIGTPVDDVIIGLKGNDMIDGRGGKDVVCGGVGNDTLSGDLGDDSLTGDLGNDDLDGGPGNDVLNGGNGTDACRNGERLKKCEA